MGRTGRKQGLPKKEQPPSFPPSLPRRQARAPGPSPPSHPASGAAPRPGRQATPTPACDHRPRPSAPAPLRGSSEERLADPHHTAVSGVNHVESNTALAKLCLKSCHQPVAHFSLRLKKKERDIKERDRKEERERGSERETLEKKKKKPTS